VQAVIKLVRPRLAVSASAGLLVALCAAAQAQDQPTADRGLDTAMTERVRGLVGSNVTLPALKGVTARMEVEIGKLDPRLRLAPCRRIEPQLPTHGALWGRTRIGLRCVEGERAWQVWLPVTVKVFAPALVSVRALPAGTVLSAEHLQTAEVDWAEHAATPFTQAAGLLGRTLGHAMQPGQAVRAADLRVRQWFAAGDTVRLRAHGDGFSVSGEGLALGAGIEGQSVRVRTESGRVLTGLPVAAHQVEVTL
jgi:flagella basal body P-ring formation protein FlgA